MTTKSPLTIGGCPHTAPMFNNTPLAVLLEIVDNLSSASYHFADDAGGEWGLARRCMKKAAKLILQHKLRSSAIVALHRERSQLMPLNDLLDEILNQATNSPNMRVVSYIQLATQAERTERPNAVWRCDIDTLLPSDHHGVGANEPEALLNAAIAYNRYHDSLDMAPSPRE